MAKSIDRLNAQLEETLRAAEQNDLDRDEVAGRLEAYAEAVRNGYTATPERRGKWWRSAHTDDEE